MIVSLTGFMGSGKTSIGRELAKLLAWRWVDLDAFIEYREGCQVKEIFSNGGEERFRSVERIALRDILESSEDMVLSLGGGTILDPSNATLIAGKSICIYLEASPEKLAEWLEGSQDRPLLACAEGETLAHRIESLLSSREERYLAAAQHTINIDRLTFREAAYIISKMVRIG